MDVCHETNPQSHHHNVLIDSTMIVKVAAGKSDGEGGDRFVKPSFEVGDYHSLYFTNSGRADTITIVGKDPDDPNKYQVQKAI